MIVFVEPVVEPTVVPGIPDQAPSVAVPVVSAEDHALGALNPSRLATQVLTGGVAPLLVYEIGRHAGLADATALAISAAPPALAIVVEWVWRRVLNVIGAIVLVGILLGLAAVFVLHGNELLLKMRESVVTGLFGLICLVSMFLPGRPALFHVGRALAGAGDRARGREFAALWEEPRARRVFTVMTAAWGAGLLLEAGIRALLAVELSTGRFLTFSPVVGWVVIGSLLYWTITYVRASRARAEAEAAATP
jgi:hypothetical protein